MRSGYANVTFLARARMKATCARSEAWKAIAAEQLEINLVLLDRRRS